MRIHRYLLVISFFIIVIIPSSIVLYYLNYRAQEQYVSTLAFTVKSQNQINSGDFLGGLKALGSVSSSDADIIFEYINSKSIVQAIEQEIGLKNLYSKHFDSDPWYSFDPNDKIEALSEYWPNMVRTYYDQGTGLVEVHVRAFDPNDAKLIADRILAESTKLINELNLSVREDSIRYSKHELDLAVEKLRSARSAMMRYRSLNRMLSPQEEIAMQAGVVNALQTQLSELFVEYDVLSVSENINDPRLSEIKLRIDIIQNRILLEREKYASDINAQTNYASLMGEFEGLLVDLEYAEKSYVSALAVYDRSLIDAQRKSKYLAAYIKPSIAETSEHPKILVIFATVLLMSFFVWATLTLAVYALKDRK